MNKISLPAFPVLKTERLILRRLLKSDDVAIALLRSDETVNKYLNRPKQADRNEAQTFIMRVSKGIQHNECMYWAISLQDNAALVGTICLWNFSEDKTTAEVGFELLPAFNGRGFMNEALQSVLSYAYQTMGFEKIVAFTHKENQSSIALLKRNNFILDPDRFDNGNSAYIVFIKRNQP
jgi:[ribosomal protein S5]-alanine N-acetyltransferase